jgi:putative NADH-flavin reductase
MTSPDWFRDMMPSSAPLILDGTILTSTSSRSRARAIIIDGVKKAGVKRVLFVGGSGRLEIRPGV